jgi:hypothetical protein
VGDEQDGERRCWRLRSRRRFEDLGLDGDVERGGGLVGDEQARVAGEGHGDHDALALAAGELVGVFGEQAFGVGELDGAERGEDAGVVGAAAGAGVKAFVGGAVGGFPAHQLGHLVADGEEGRRR